MIKMKVHRYIHNPKELLKQGQEIVKQNSDLKFIHRVTVVNLVLSGMKTKDLSQYCGDSIRTIIANELNIFLIEIPYAT